MKKYHLGKDELYCINTDTLINCEASQPPELIKLMRQKAESVAQNWSFGSYTERVLFIDAFYKGYLSAFIVNDEQDQIENSLTPLGQALKED
jgi:hypothetical protein